MEVKKVKGEIDKMALDVDSHFLSAFGPEDRELCEHCAKVMGTFLDTQE